jgi:hypothetical protein
MNERIQLLMGQALDEKFAGTWSVMDLQDLTKFADRFAELIVQECADIAYDTQYNHGRASYETGSCSRAIRQHFGVEE